jgi:hypothetical protein
MLTMVSIRFNATDPAAMSGKVVSEDGVGETTAVVIVAATTKVEAAVDADEEDVAVGTWQCGVDRGLRRPRETILAARGLVDHPHTSLRDLAVTDEYGPIHLEGYHSPFDPIISLYTRFLSRCHSAVSGMMSRQGNTLAHSKTIDCVGRAIFSGAKKGRAFKPASTV